MELPLRTDDFEYHLPPGQIAQQPLWPRDSSGLLTLKRNSGQVGHSKFRDLPSLLRPGDLLVVNDTKVIPARFWCRRDTGGRIEGLLLQELAQGWEVMLKGAGRCKVGQSLQLEKTQSRLLLRENLGQGRWRLEVDPPAPAQALLETAGEPPLPPYIHRKSPQAGDLESYQTVYARQAGAVAAPTAGLHFTPELLERLRQAQVQLTQVTLHVGPGTFLPVKVGRLADHHMHSEQFDISPAAARAICDARAQGRRIVAVGTTVVRVLESAAARGELSPQCGRTDIFIYPPYDFRMVDALITNFHLPRSTLLMLVAAFCSPGLTAGVELVLRTYAQAVQHGYRFYSYGDAMLIE